MLHLCDSLNQILLFLVPGYLERYEVTVQREVSPVRNVMPLSSVSE